MRNERTQDYAEEIWLEKAVLVVAGAVLRIILCSA
jgi:hypothetical protein